MMKVNVCFPQEAIVLHQDLLSIFVGGVEVVSYSYQNLLDQCKDTVDYLDDNTGVNNYYTYTVLIEITV